LALWQGLGYYARARNLPRGAGVVCREHGGRVPGDAAAFRALPGVGDYVAGAVLSIAFGQALPAVDGNVVRVLCRLFDEPGDVARAPLKGTLRAWAAALLAPERPGDYNQALMELGATVCTPKGPLCAQCPLAVLCRAQARGTQLERPTSRPRPARPRRARAAAWIWRGEGAAAQVLLARRRPAGLLGGLWELPAVPLRGLRRRRRPWHGHWTRRSTWPP
jgi:A/G-specific adenine glycosylase